MSILQSAISACITAQQLPGAYFSSRQALMQFASQRLKVEAICHEYERTRDESELLEGLGRLGYDRDEIAALAANPGSRPQEMYIA